MCIRCLTNAMVCNSSPLAITSRRPRQMCVVTLLSWPMSPGWHGIWIRRCNIPQKRLMCGRTATMPLYLHGGSFMVIIRMVCGVFTMCDMCVHPTVPI